MLSVMHMEILSRFKNTYEVNMKDWKSSGNLISFNEIHCIKRNEGLEVLIVSLL